MRHTLTAPLEKRPQFLYVFLFIVGLFVVLGTYQPSSVAVAQAGGTTYYIDFDSGSDSNSGTARNSAWKHAPGDPNATANAKRVLVPGDTILFKGGVHYRGSIIMGANGAAGNPITYKGDGWGSEKAIIDGSEVVTGWTICASSSECGNNSNWKHIYHTTIPNIPGFLGTTPEIRLNIVQDDKPVIPAQIPESINRYYQNSSTYYSVAPANVTTTSISDSRLATLGGANLVGSYVYIWASPNDIFFQKISAFDTRTNTISFPKVSVYTNKNTLYAIANNIGDPVFNRAGQYYFNPVANSAGRYELFLWPLNNTDVRSQGNVTRSVRDIGFNINGKDYVTIQGFLIEKQTGDSTGEGHAIHQGVSSRATHTLIDNNEITLSNGTSGGSITVTWADDNIISNNYVHDTLGNMRGIQAGGATNMAVTNNQVRNISRTGIYFGDVQDSQIGNNTVDDVDSSHGNGITVYQGSDNIDVYKNVVTNSNLNYTMENSSNVHVYNNIFDGSDVTNYVLVDWGGMSGANTIYNNTIVNSSGSSALQVKGGGSSTWVIKNNIIDGGKVTNDTTGVTYANNLYTGLSSFQASRYGWALKSGEFVETNLNLIFTTPSNQDYTLFSTSRAVDAGLDLSASYTDDLLGTTRPQGSAYDIGAYEYVSGIADTTAPAVSAGAPSGVLSTGTTASTISVTTNESATCYYATSGGLAYTSMTVFGTTNSTDHSSSISGLIDGGNYVYYVKCRDALGNTNSSDYTISFSVGSDTTAPTISSITETGLSTVAVTIGWVTNENADSQVEYGTVLDDYTDQTALDATLATSHSANVTGLTPDTTYYYRILSRDSSGNLRQSSPGSFATLAIDDVTAPTISSIASSTTATTATISWTTDELTTPLVYYGTTASYGTASTSGTYALSPSITLTGLSASTTYHYQITATDPSDNVATSSDLTFTTGADTTAPTISAIASTTGATTAVITWTTDETSDSQVLYGLDSTYGTATTLDSSLTTSHSVTLSSLIESTIYHYQIVTSDASSNQATSSDLTLTTTAAGSTDSGGGGSSSGGGSTGSTSTTTATTTTITNTNPPDITSIFTRELSLGDRGLDVRVLQKILIVRGYLKSGLDTGFFGELTRQAVSKFQKVVGVTPSNGYFGWQTIRIITGQEAPGVPEESVVATTTTTMTTDAIVPVPPTETVVVTAPAIAPATTPSTPSVAPDELRMLVRILTLGSRGVDVAILQQVMKDQGYYRNPITGIFDLDTATALSVYQRTHNIRTEPGFTGPITRDLINRRR